MAGYWDQLVDAVIRPPRDSYRESDLVGGARANFSIGDRQYYREDLTLLNKYNQRLAASHYRPCVVVSPDGRLPAIIYVHANSGSRQDAEEILEHVLPLHFTVLAVDCAGSGLSDGKHVTLGAREQDDVEAAVRYLESQGVSSSIVLWGRSQGAVASALLASRGAASGVDAVVLDSPFSRLRDLMMEIAESTPFRAARPIMSVALALMRRSVRRRAGFDVNSVAPIDAVPRATVPALFCHAEMDSFVGCHHSKLLQQAYGGISDLLLLEGDHNSVRPLWWYEAACAFLLSTLKWTEMSRRVTPAVMDTPAPPPLTNRHRGLNPPWSPKAISSMRRSTAGWGKLTPRPDEDAAPKTGEGSPARSPSRTRSSRESSPARRPASPTRPRSETVLAALAGGPPPREMSASVSGSSAAAQGPLGSPLRAAAMRRACSDAAVGSAPSSPSPASKHALSAAVGGAPTNQSSAPSSPSHPRPVTAPTAAKATTAAPAAVAPAAAAAVPGPALQRSSSQRSASSLKFPPSSLTSPSAWMSAPMSSSPTSRQASASSTRSLSGAEAAPAASVPRSAGATPGHSRSSSHGSPQVGPGPPRRPGSRPSATPVPAAAGGWLHSNATNGWGMPTADSSPSSPTLQRPAVPGKDDGKTTATVVEVVEVESSEGPAAGPKPDFDAPAQAALGGPAPLLTITAGESSTGAFGVTVVEVPTSEASLADRGARLENALLGVTVTEPDSP